MNHERISKNAERSIFRLGIDRHNMHGPIEAKQMPYPYLHNWNAKSAYFAGINAARYKRAYP